MMKPFLLRMDGRLKTGCNDTDTSDTSADTSAANVIV